MDADKRETYLIKGGGRLRLRPWNYPLGRATCGIQHSLGETPDGKLHRGSAPFLRLKPSEQNKLLVLPLPMNTECTAIMPPSDFPYNAKMSLCRHFLLFVGSVFFSPKNCSKIPSKGLGRSVDCGNAVILVGSPSSSFVARRTCISSMMLH